MNKNAKAWIEALRSGDYQEGSRVLHSTLADVDTFCCLGVACDLAVKAGVVERRNKTGEYYIYGDEGAGAYLPLKVQEWLGVTTTDPQVTDRSYVNGPTTLSALNDSESYTFKELADIIEAEVHFV